MDKLLQSCVTVNRSKCETGGSSEMFSRIDMSCWRVARPGERKAEAQF